MFGRIAGERAATIKHPDRDMFPNAKLPSALEHESNFVPVVLREVRNTDLKYGLNTREIRFSMHGSFQHSVSIDADTNLLPLRINLRNCSCLS